MKTVFVAHPVRGDVAGNMQKVLAICEELHTKEVIPVVPFLVSLQYLKDHIVEDRELGIQANHECLRRRYVDELWLFGDHISSGMAGEVKLARELGIPVVPQTEGTRRDLEALK